MSSPAATPMIKQYLAIKDQYPDAILFYRMGDFYEMFFQDAEVASRALDITLTSRNKKDPSPVPMCGVPYRAAQGYIARLIEQGFKVAICDQVEDPATAKGLVKREVVRVITPGMIIENEFLDAKTNNYVLAVDCTEEQAGLAYLDISTGTFRVSQSDDLQGLVDEILRVSPSEVVLPESARHNPLFQPVASIIGDRALTYLEDGAYGYGRGRKRLLEQFGTLSLEGFGCERLRAGVSAAGALMYYVRETQKQKTAHITGIETYPLGSYLLMDDLSCRNLEIFENIRTRSRTGTLIGVIDQTVTALGGRLLKRWLRYPLIDPDRLRRRHDAVEEAVCRTGDRNRIREALKSVYDLERLGSKITMGHANARDLLALKTSLLTLPSVLGALSEFEADLYLWNPDGDHLQELADLIDRAIREDAPPTISEGRIIRKGFNPELDDLVAVSRDGKSWLAKLEAREKEQTGITSLKVRYNKVFGYYIEVPKSRAETVPAHYVRKQTLVNAERYITDELKSFESRVLGAEERRSALEYEIFNGIREEIVRHNSEIQKAAAFLARLDCLMSLAEIADQNGYCRPLMTSDGCIRIEEGRHPVVEKMITGERFVPNTVVMDNREQQVLIITGPNMAGKSTVLRQVAILVTMAQMGSFVPADAARISITDRIFTRVGALDNLSHGQSTFMVEMQETANILNNATADSLVIMDEIGRGTSTFDGLSIAWAVAEYLHDLKGTGVKTLFATHYHELTELSETRPRARNYNIAVREWNDEIIFLRKLAEGGTNRSYGIQVARLAGVPEPVLVRAKQILSQVEKGGAPETDRVRRLPGKAHRQLDLFNSPENLILKEINELDLSNMTPIEALNRLYELQQKARTEPHYPAALGARS